MTTARSRVRRLAAIVLAMSALAALLPAASAAALSVAAAPEYAGVVFRGDIDGLVLLDERPAGVRVGIVLEGLPRAGVRLVAATARCGQVGGTTAGLGLLHPFGGRFAGVWVNGTVDSVDAVGSLRLVIGGRRVACANTIHGDEQIDVCEAVPDACYGLMALPERLDQKVLQGILVRITQRDGGPVRFVVGRASGEVDTVILGDAPCDAGGGDPIARIELPVGVGLTTGRLALRDAARIGSFWFVLGGGTLCVDAEVQALVRAG